MNMMRLVRISAMADGTYELMFEAGEDQLRFICEIQERHGIQVVSTEPSLTRTDPDDDGPDVGDPRPVAAAVLAMHRARQI